MIVSGVALFGAFYSFDLFAMYGLPSIMSPEIAMVVMKELHLEFSWIVSLAGIGLIITGHLLNNKKLSSLIGRLESIQNDLIEENKQRGKNQEDLERRVQERTQKLQSPINSSSVWVVKSGSKARWAKGRHFGSKCPSHIPKQHFLISSKRHIEP
jgi:hypothetical protein